MIEFRKIGDDWTKRPITLTLAGIQTQAVNVGGSVPDAPNRSDEARAAALDEVHRELAREEDRLADERMRQAREHAEAERVRVPAEEFRSWFGGSDGA